MVSLAYLITTLCAIIAVSRADEFRNGGKEGQLDSKWFGDSNRWGLEGSGFYSGYNVGLYSWLSQWTNNLNGGCYGYAVLGNLYNEILFSKDTSPQRSKDTSSQPANTSPQPFRFSRRAVSLSAEHLRPRGIEKIACINEKGTSDVFVQSDCSKAAQKLADSKLSNAVCGTCALSLVSPSERVVAKQITVSSLEKAAYGILNACSKTENSKKTRRDGGLATFYQGKQVAMILSKGNGTPCN